MSAVAVKAKKLCIGCLLALNHSSDDNWKFVHPRGRCERIFECGLFEPKQCDGRAVVVFEV